MKNAMVAISNTVVIKSFYFAYSQDTDALCPIWIQSSGSQLRFWCPGLVSLKLLANVTKWNIPLGKCTSEVTRLKPTRLDGLTIAIWDATKKLHAKAITSILAKKSANSTIELRKQDRKILFRIRQGSTWNEQTTEVHIFLLVCLSFLARQRSHFEGYSLASNYVFHGLFSNLVLTLSYKSRWHKHANETHASSKQINK